MVTGTEPAPGTSGGLSGEEYTVPIGDLLQVLRRRVWVILLVALLCAVAAVGFSLTRTPQYEATITILVGQEESQNTPNNLGSDVQGLQQLTQTMTEAVNSRPVAAAVIEDLGLRVEPDEFLENLSVEQVPNTQFIEVAYTDPYPEDARLIANTVGEVFSEQISEISPSANSITATVWEQAAAPEDSVSPDPVRNGLLALALGLMLGVGLAFLLEYLDNSWRSPEEAERVSGVPTLGLIPVFDRPKDKKGKTGSFFKRREQRPKGGGEWVTEKPLFRPEEEPYEGEESARQDPSERLVTMLDPLGMASESYRTIRTNLIYSLVDLPLQVVVMTSPGPGEGKSTTCANLGVTLAQAGKRVLVLDCDLRRPALHKVFGVRNLYGVVNVLAGERELSKVWEEPLEGMKVVTAGPVPPNPAELLGSRSFAELLGQVRGDFDYILLDTPPVEAVSDAVVLGSQSDGVLLVLDAQQTRKGAVRRSVQSLEAVGANVLGTVMNNVKKGQGGYYYGYKYE